MKNKHKLVASNYHEFSALFEELMKDLDRCGEKVVKSVFKWDNDAYKGYVAKLWTVSSKEKQGD
jgi:hypothetical protein